MVLFQNNFSVAFFRGICCCFFASAEVGVMNYVTLGKSKCGNEASFLLRISCFEKCVLCAEGPLAYILGFTEVTVLSVQRTQDSVLKFHFSATLWEEVPRLKNMNI